jgi:hypothetical protein
MYFKLLLQSLLFISFVHHLISYYISFYKPNQIRSFNVIKGVGPVALNNAKETTISPQNMTLSAICGEITSLGYSYKGIYDRFELEKMLLKSRELVKLKVQNEIMENSRIRQNKVNMYCIEANKINQLSYDSIFEELEELDYPTKSLSLKEAKRLLLMARMENDSSPPIESSSKASENIFSVISMSSNRVASDIMDSFNTSANFALNYSSRLFHTSHETRAIESIGGLNKKVNTSAYPSYNETYPQEIGTKSYTAAKTSEEIKQKYDKIKSINIFNEMLSSIKSNRTSINATERRSTGDRPALLLLKPVSFLLSYATGFVVSLAKWSGGDKISSSNVLFIASSLCMVLKKGPLAFILCLLLIRFIRLLFQFT